MLDSFVYENHLGLRFEGLANRVYVNYNELRDYSWSYDTINNRISRFYRPIKDRKIPLVICCASDAEAVQIKNRLLELADADIEALHPGKVRIGEYYTNGYVTESKKSNYLINKRLCNLELTLTSDDPAWYREEHNSFIPGLDTVIGTDSGIDYAYDYPSDYMQTLQGNHIVCESMSANAFRLRIYGATADPSIVIGGHIYSVTGVIGADEVLEIDSLTKTITLITATGKRTNWFDKRNRESYIFEPIPAGKHAIAWSGGFGFDLTIIEKRSEPKWT